MRVLTVNRSRFKISNYLGWSWDTSACIEISDKNLEKIVKKKTTKRQKATNVSESVKNLKEATKTSNPPPPLQKGYKNIEKMCPKKPVKKMTKTSEIKQQKTLEKCPKNVGNGNKNIENNTKT